MERIHFFLILKAFYFLRYINRWTIHIHGSYNILVSIRIGWLWKGKIVLAEI